MKGEQLWVGQEEHTQGQMEYLQVHLFGKVTEMLEQK
jgi:hypothetical protein